MRVLYFRTVIKVICVKNYMDKIIVKFPLFLYSFIGRTIRCNFLFGYT